MLLVKRFINTVRKCRPPGKRLASRTWKRADSPSASEQEIHKPQRPFGRLLLHSAMEGSLALVEFAAAKVRLFLRKT